MSDQLGIAYFMAPACKNVNWVVLQSLIAVRLYASVNMHANLLKQEQGGHVIALKDLQKYRLMTNMSAAEVDSSKVEIMRHCIHNSKVLFRPSIIHERNCAVAVCMLSP